MSQPDEFLNRFNESPDDPPFDPYGEPLRGEKLRAAEAALLSLTAGSHPATPASEPANRPASTSGVSLSLTGENPGPAGAPSLVGICSKAAA